MANIIEVSDLGCEEVSLFRLGENALRHYFEPKEGLFIAESLRVIERALAAGYLPYKALVGRDELEQSLELLSGHDELEIYVGDDELLSQIAGFKLVRGVLCAMHRRPLPTVEQVCKNAGRVAVLENVVNPTNVGAIFRSAAALGMDAVLLTKGCADPLSRRAARVGVGTVFQAPWTFCENAADVKRFGFKMAGMALTENSMSLDGLEPPTGRLAVVMGNENNGISSETLSECDLTVRIPMMNGVDSLNVAAASAVAFWCFGRRI